MERLDFRSIVENSQDLIYLLDTSGNTVYVNPAIEYMLGYKSEEILGKSFFDLMTPESRSISSEHFKSRMIGERPPVKYIVDLVTKDGKVKNCETHVQIVMGQNGRPWVQGIVRDLTEQLALTNAIGVEKRRFESLVETASSIIVGTDMKGRITLFNHGAEAALGYLKQEALGRNFFELLVPENDHEKLLNLMWKTMQTKETPQGIASMLTKRGDLVKVNWTVNFLMNDQNETEGFLGIGQDMTERVKLEEELKDRNKILEVLSQLGLISSISFDSRKIVSAALEMTMRLFDFQKGTAFIVNSVSGNIEKVATANLENPNLEWNGVSHFPEVFKETVISKGQMVIIKEGNKDPRLADTMPEMESAILLPLKGHTNTIGVLCMCSSAPHDFTLNDQASLEAASLMLGYPLENSQLYESLRRSSGLVALYNDIILHDATNYIVPVISYVALADENLGNQEAQTRYLKKALSSLERLSNFLADVQFLIKTIEEKEVKLGPINLMTQLNDAMEVTKGRFDVSNIIFEQKSAENLQDVYVVANKALTHLYVNILTNAVKHGAPEQVVVRREVDKARGICRVEVEDMGAGVSDDNKQRVFERRFAEGSVRAPKGSGLGLTIVKTLVDKYHGRIWVEDRVKGDHTKGAKFIVELPLAEVQNA